MFNFGSNELEDVAPLPAGDDAFLLSQKDAAAFFGKSVKTISRMRKRGELGYVKAGGSVWIPKDALEVWLDSHSYGPLASGAAPASLDGSKGRPQQKLFKPPVVSLRELDAEMDQSEDAA